MDIESPTYSDLNELIAQTVSSLTASMRFNGELNSNLLALKTNLVPYPRMNLLISSYSPIASAEKAHYELFSVLYLTDAVFEPGSIMIKCDPSMEKYMACSLMYRGNVIPRDVSAAIPIIKSRKSIEFVDWCPTGFKYGINNQPSMVVPAGNLIKAVRSCCMVSNSTAIAQVLARIGHKFDLLYAKRSFIYWYVGEGMSEAEIPESREDMLVIQKDYEDVRLSEEDIENE